MLLVEYCEFVDCAHFCRNTELLLNSYINPLNTKSDQHLISPYSDTAKSFIEIMRMKEMIANLRITHKGHDSRRNDYQQKKLLISKQILLVSTLGNV